MDLDRVLRDRFGFPDFRPGQREICAHVAGGGDALVVMPIAINRVKAIAPPALTAIRVRILLNI